MAAAGAAAVGTAASQTSTVVVSPLMLSGGVSASGGKGDKDRKSDIEQGTAAAAPSAASKPTL
jgi:hypothetical protein